MHLLDEALEARRKLALLSAEADRQLSELVDFVEGKRQSEAPLGSRFLLNLGGALENLTKDVGSLAKKGEKRWKN